VEWITGRLGMVPVNDMDSRQSYRNPKCKASRIPVVIVESHQHALEHVHEVLRKAKLLSVPWSMFHFDAHPDLACPANVPAAACFTPRNTVFPEEGEGEDDDASNNSDDSHNDPTNHQKNLYELLDDTTTGIAEWILPLVLAGNLRYVEWVKPCFSNQMDVGDYHYSVGVKDEPQSGSHSTKLVKCFLDLSKMARIKVDLLHPVRRIVIEARFSFAGFRNATFWQFSDQGRTLDVGHLPRLLCVSQPISCRY
jgi:UPF0489 domain